MERLRQKHELIVPINYEGFKSKPKIVDLSLTSTFDATSTFNYYEYLTNIGD